MTHVEDLITKPEGALVKRLIEGTRNARKRAQTRDHTRFTVYLYGPDHNNDDVAGRQVAAMALPVDDTGEVGIDDIRRGFIDAQRRGYADASYMRGPLELRFLSDPGREELSASSRWEDIVWGPRAAGGDNPVDVGGEHELHELHEGISEEEDALGFVHREALDYQSDHDRDYRRNMDLGFQQREMVKDIERDTMMRQLFEQVMESRRNEHDMLASALDFQRRITLRAVDQTFGGGGPRPPGAGQGGSPASGMKIAGDLYSFWKSMGKPGAGNSRALPNRRNARRLDDPNAARPAVAPPVFDETSWSGGGGAGPGRGAAVDRMLAAKSARELSDGTDGPRSNVPALREEPPADYPAVDDPQSVIDSMDDAELIRAVGGRISEIAGDHAPIVDNFLSTRLEELEGGGYEGGYEGGFDDEDIPD